MKGERTQARGLRLFARFLKKSWQWIVVAVLTLTLGVVAYASPGLEEADVHLDEGTVYAVKRDAGLIGTVNTQIEELTAATNVGDSQSQVLQSEEVVLVHGQESNTLTVYNPGRNRLESPVTLPAGSEVQLVGSKLLVNNSQNGRVWFGEVEDVLSMDLMVDEAQFEVGENGLATLTTGGNVIGLSVEDSAVVRQRGDETVTTELPFTLDAQRLGGVQLSAVGENAVVFDQATGRIWVEGMDDVFDVSGAPSAQLMEPVPQAFGGQDGVRAVYATEAGLIGVTPDGPRSLSGQMNGTPIAPTQLDDCIYGVFGAQHVKRCAGGQPEVREIPGYDGSSQESLSFQVNRRTVALNEAVEGVIWLVDQDMARIDEWDDLIPETTDEPPPPDAPDTQTQPDRSQENRPPVAQDDELAARKGRATTLPVLDNDSDPDGDVLTIRAPREIDGASLQLVRGGAGLQVTIPPETSATSLTFEYEIFDGEYTDSATVTVQVVDEDPAKENRPPYEYELAQPMAVQLGGSFTKRLLLDWRDPEGDPLILQSASLPPGSEDLVTFTPDGTINYQDIGKSAGTKKINVVVSDGEQETSGELVVDVEEDVVPPLAYGDFETVPVGETVDVEPLVNDIGENLALTEVDVSDCTVCDVTPNYTDGTFTFSATQVGTYYLTYKVSNGPVATGVVRVDVVAPGTDNPPIAALDVALLPPGGSVFVDPLLNDTDVDGDVLVVQSFSSDPSLQVVMERRHLMTISANSTPDAPVTIEYIVSDGRHTARGTIIVIPTQNTGSTAPEAADDDIRVRAGSAATAHVLENDQSPIGLDLELNRLLENPLGDNAWIDGDTIRMTAPPGSQAQQVAISYEVVDEDGATASATLNATVVSEDAPNEAPQPEDVVDRVLSGSTTRIPIPLDDIDPNGDAVRLVGLGSGPRLGRVVEVGEAYLTYEAFPSSQGTDSFQYEVVDAHGEVARGQVRIGVAPPGEVNEPPIAVPDQVRVRPGRPIQIPALANDYDIEGDAFGFPESNAVKMDDPTLSASVVNDREIMVDPISEPGIYTGSYRIMDLRQQEGSGTFEVIVDENAPLLPPVARDDTLSVSAIVGEEYVEVEPLLNDFDPDGPHEELQISLPDVAADTEDETAPRITEEGTLSVPILEHTQQVRYQLTDADENASYGIVTVPGTQDAIPMVRDSTRTHEATAGQPMHINFEDVLVGTEGREVKLTSSDSIMTTTGNAVPATGGIEFTPASEYHGPAAVVFEVIDVVPEGDETAKRAYVSIPVEVKRPEDQAGENGETTVANLPPEQLSAPHLQVAPDEGEFRLSLMPLFRDPQGMDFNFTEFTQTAGDAQISWHTESGESVIVASAPVEATPGTTVTLSGEVRNASGASRPIEVLLEVIPSRQPLTTAVTDVVDEAQAGVPVPVDVTANDTSHLVNDQTLTVTGARIISGSGDISFENNVVTITPSEGFVGTLTASYSVMDATGDESRQVDGSIRMTVSDVPSAPSAPFGGVPGDGHIRFEYRSGSANGHPIERRVVTATAPGQSPVEQECSGNTCTVTGLQNNMPWTLQVVEYNKLGASEPSPTSAQYTPDVKPLAPPRPSAERGDKELTVSWEAARFENMDNQGSPVTDYKIALYDASGAQLGTRTVPASPRSYTWTGLTNGSNYTFSIVATNNAGDSPASERSVAMFPVGPPQGSASVTADPVGDDQGGSFQVSVNTANLNANGDPDMKVYVVPVRGNQALTDRRREITYPSGETQRVTLNGFGEAPMSFKVVAENLHSSRDMGNSGSPIVSWPRPTLHVDGAWVSLNNPGSALFRLRTSTVSDPGRAGLRYEYLVGGSGSWKPLQQVSGGLWRTGADLPIGSQTRVDVRARLTNASNDRVSSVTSTPLTAVSGQPKAVPLGEIKARYPDQVTVSVDPSPGAVASGGWTNGRYSLVGPWQTEPSVTLPVGTTRVETRWSGRVPGTVYGSGGHDWGGTVDTNSVQVADPFETSKSGNNFQVTVRYADPGSSCTVYDRRGAGRKELDKIAPNSGRVISLDKAYTDGKDSDGNTKYRSSVYVQCIVNGTSDGWEANIN